MKPGSLRLTAQQAGLLASLAGFLLLTGCVATPESYPLPPAHPALQAPEPKPVPEMIDLKEPRSRTMIVSGVWGEEGQHCWTDPRAIMQFKLSGTGPRKARFDFTIVNMTFRDTGPLTIEFAVNARDLKTITYKTPGLQRFSEPVPVEWLSFDRPNQLSITVRNPWIAPGDGRAMGVILRAAGFER